MARKLLAVLLVLTAPWAACATTYLVLPDGSGDFPTIQAAVDAASDGDQILLASGTFAGDGNRDVSLLGKAITLRSQVDDPTACIIDCGGAAGNARRAFLFVNGEGENSILRSVTVTNGWLEGWDWQDGTGGAVYCYAASPTIERCVFSGNSARAGGAMTVYYGSNPAIIDCTFEGNDAYTAGNGGGLLISASVHPLVSGCVFRNNGGTGISSEGTGTEVRNCEFSGPTHFGMSCGAVYVYPYVIDRCRFFSNLDSGLRCTSPGGTISSCEFWDNEANRGSALLLVFGFAGTISDCLFYENRAADSGGAVWCGDATATFESCTMAYNEAASGAGGIDCGTATVTLENTIIAFSTGGQAIAGNADLSCCDLYGNAGGDWIGGIAGQYGIDGNISEDPIFCGPWSDDFTLQSDSPCAPFSSPNPECDLIGSEPVGCTPSPTEATSWGGVKALFREGTD